MSAPTKTGPSSWGILALLLLAVFLTWIGFFAAIASDGCEYRHPTCNDQVTSGSFLAALPQLPLAIGAIAWAILRARRNPSRPWLPLLLGAAAMLAVFVVGMGRIVAAVPNSF